MIKKGKLKNGLTVVTSANKNSQTIVASVGVKVGSRYENKHEYGLSHALEHMLFKGTENRTSNELNETVDFVGAQTNAYTSEEQTVYYIKGLKEHLEMAIDVLSDQVLNSIFPAEEMSKEMEVIEQEIKRAFDDPSDMVYYGFKEIAFKNSPLEHPILGSAEQVLSYRPKDMLKYYQKHYCLENMVLSVSGNVEHSEVIKLAKKYFKNDRRYKKQKVKKTKWNSGQKLVHVDSENQVSVMIGWPLIGRTASTKKDRMIVKLLDAIMSSGMSSKLFREIRERRGLVYSVGSHVHFYDDLGYFVISGGTDHNKIEEFFEATSLVLKNFNNDLVEKDLIKAKNDTKASLCMQSENNSSVAMGHIDSIQNYGEPYNLKEQLKLVDTITLDDIKNCMNKILSKKAALSVYGFCPQIQSNSIGLDKFEKMLYESR